MKAKLVIVGGTTKTKEVELRLPAIIGRGREAGITIRHSLVSRQHCELLEEDGKLIVRDLDSLNGTYVGDERVETAVIEPGGLLTVGTVTFRAVYEVGSDDAASEDDAADIDFDLDEDLDDDDTDLVIGDDETTRFEGDSSLLMKNPARSSATADEPAPEEPAAEADSEPAAEADFEPAAGEEPPTDDDPPTDDAPAEQDGVPDSLRAFLDKQR